ncbi:MAG: porin [Gemmataceae bacterium]
MATDNKVDNPALYDSLHDGSSGGLKSLFDSFHLPTEEKSKHWYDKMTIRGYTQFRVGSSLLRDAQGGPVTMFGDRSIGDNTGTFSVRRARLIISEDVSDYLRLYFQSDFANNPSSGSTNTNFAQIRDLYGDIYLDKTQVHRFRVGMSKIPWGFEEMQSSSNRLPLDRSDAIDSGDTPNQRDLGVFYYWTPEDKQKLLEELVTGGLKGSGNYGIFAFGLYNGQGGSQVDLNRNFHTVARFTWPFQLSNGQVVEVSLQGYTGKYVVRGDAIQPLGKGAFVVPAGTGGGIGVRDERLAGTFVWYPQPFGFQTEWNVGRGPGLNDSQTAVESRSLDGGYAMAMYKIDTRNNGIFFPFARYQQYHGGYRSISNAPYGQHREYDLGVEWQIRKEMEMVVEYGFVNGVSLDPSTRSGVPSYRNYDGQVLRCQFQINY